MNIQAAISKITTSNVESCVKIRELTALYFRHRVSDVLVEPRKGPSTMVGDEPEGMTLSDVSRIMLAIEMTATRELVK